jgi:DNA invertase Pin-like site-specific DNA recombinase
MTSDTVGKVQTRHLKRKAYLYVRQSTLRQVFENTESTQRQYSLKQRAIALGWASDQVEIIDKDLGQSGASAADREGFQNLVTEVGMGRAGIVMGLEVSRLARNSTDWHRLIEICALTDTLILDEDGVYDPAHFNDRLVLGLKGTMSEAELHLLRARLIGGVLNKAKRGELHVRLPVGFVYDVAGRVALDPDSQVQQTLRSFFETVRRTGSATATVKAFRQQGLRFPHRVDHGPNKGNIIWGELVHHRAIWILHNPRYAGAFFYGRSRQRKMAHGGRYLLERDEWTSFIQDAHVAYISWDDFERNQQLLRDNAAAHGADRRRSPPREGPALLQGLVICGRCGRRMTVRYHQPSGKLVPEYVCQGDGVQHAQRICQSVSGAVTDEAVGQLVVDRVTPMALEVTLAVQKEVDARFEQADALRRKHVERAQYEVDVARRRYMRVDPDNRLVADSLEAEWNARLRALAEAKEQYARQREADHAALDEQQRARILRLSSDLPALWHDPATPDRERKRMLRLLIDDATLLKGKDITVHVRFRGGATHTLSLPRPRSAWQLRQIDPDLIAAIDRLIQDHTDDEIASILTERGVRTYEGTIPHPRMIQRLKRDYGLKSRFDRLRERGRLTLQEVAKTLGVAAQTVKVWRAAGRLRAIAYDNKGSYLYEAPGEDAPAKYEWQRRASIKVASHRTKGVQYEA